MNCIKCRNKTKVVEVRPHMCYNAKKRRRECTVCGLRFNTYEDVIAPVGMMEYNEQFEEVQQPVASRILGIAWPMFKEIVTGIRQTIIERYIDEQQ